MKVENKIKLHKEYRKSKCKYCNFKTDSKDELIEHKIRLHCSYPRETHIEHIKNNPDSKVGSIYKKYYLSKQKKKVYDGLEPKEKKVRLGSNIYEWKNNDIGYERIDGIPFIVGVEDGWIKDELGWYKPIVYTRDKPTTIDYTISCKNCMKYTIINGSLTTRKKTLNPDSILLCIFCGMDMLKDNRLKILNWINKGNKLPDGIRRDVVYSVVGGITSNVDTKLEDVLELET